MIDAIKSTQLAMISDQNRLQTINQNISNMLTPGYKQQLVDLSFKEQLSTELNPAFPQLQNAHNLTQGPMMHTKASTDLALAGEGFFVVHTEKGLLYTRRGDLHLNEHGELSSFTGGLVMGRSGSIVINDNEFSVDKKGNISIGDQKIDQLRIVKFSSNQPLSYLGQGLYQSSESPLPAESTTPVLQGYIEQSNVKSVDEMMELVKTSRHFEASQHVMRIADGLLSTAITQLGEGNV
ncbi:MAG: flagellar hook basal-body protein [Tatlockia sp.]|nr:flagellar hook basal-body protein [Tatlockia sp.]